MFCILYFIFALDVGSFFHKRTSQGPWMTPALPRRAQPQARATGEINRCKPGAEQPSRLPVLTPQPTPRPADAEGAAGLSDACLRFQLSLQGTGTLALSPDKREP